MHSPKAMFLQKGDILPSIPIAYAVHKKEICENTKQIISCVNYKTYQWNIRGNLKVIATFMEL
jgi:hypothetical protein